MRLILETIKALFRKVEAKIPKKLSDLVNDLKVPTPDWNENDPNSEGYIQNRPFYEETGKVEIVPQTVLNLDLDKTPNIEVLSYELGQAVIVEFDGKKYETKIVDGYFMGDNAIVARFNTDDNVEVVIALDIGCIGATPELSGEHTICMYYQGTKVKQIDPKFIPNAGGNAVEDVEIFLRVEDKPNYRINYSGGPVPLQGSDTYWYFVDEDAGAKLVEALNDRSRFFRFIIYLDSDNMIFGRSYQTTIAPGFVIPWDTREYVFTKESL